MDVSLDLDEDDRGEGFTVPDPVGVAGLEEVPEEEGEEGEEPTGEALQRMREQAAELINGK